MFKVLRYTLGGLVLLFGFDKFFNIFTDWTQYVPDILHRFTGLSDSFVMEAVGVAEIITGLVALFSPVIGGYLLAAGFFVVSMVLLVGQGHYNLVLVNLVFAVHSLLLTRMSKSGRA
jgi:hypothetical protein